MYSLVKFNYRPGGTCKLGLLQSLFPRCRYHHTVCVCVWLQWPKRWASKRISEWIRWASWSTLVNVCGKCKKKLNEWEIDELKDKLRQWQTQRERERCRKNKIHRIDIAGRESYRDKTLTVNTVWMDISLLMLLLFRLCYYPVQPCHSSHFHVCLNIEIVYIQIQFCCHLTFKSFWNWLGPVSHSHSALFFHFISFHVYIRSFCFIDRFTFDFLLLLLMLLLSLSLATFARTKRKNQLCDESPRRHTMYI